MRRLRIIAPLILGLAVGSPFVGQTHAQGFYTESNTDRPGGDYRYFGTRTSANNNYALALQLHSGLRWHI